MRSAMSKHEMLSILDKLATPIDFPDLVARGVLKKAGRWYVLLRPQELPEHAWRQAASISTSTSGDRQTVKLTFKDTTKAAKTLRARIAESG